MHVSEPTAWDWLIFSKEFYCKVMNDVFYLYVKSDCI